MPEPRKDTGLVMAVRYSHIAFALPAGAFVGWLIGGALTRWTGREWMTMAGLILGIVAGFYELIRAVLKISKES